MKHTHECHVPTEAKSPGVKSTRSSSRVPLAIHGIDVRGRGLSVALVSWDLTLYHISQEGHCTGSMT